MKTKKLFFKHLIICVFRKTLADQTVIISRSFNDRTSSTLLL